ncbi:MAG TPA: cytochrome c [Pusillimonas sp.]|uniref:c-type cytochrome n=1 Tax=Pusillimonas sp. TaxID=3040095 RepID=UPI002B93BEBD|nr:cytochrome c [Pusillimonas sp.]HUH87279.1 cytochrome c [Pusillimonas sp.]
MSGLNPGLSARSNSRSAICANFFTSLTFPKISKCVALVGAGGLLAFAGVAGAQESGWTSGAQAYSQVCAYCHDGGQVGPVLKGRNLPPAFFTAIARNGLRAMPAFPASFIDDATLQAVGEYLSTSPPEATASGKAPEDSAQRNAGK